MPHHLVSQQERYHEARAQMRAQYEEAEKKNASHDEVCIVNACYFK